MSLFAAILKAQDNGGSVRYLRGPARHVCRVVRTRIREADPLKGVKQAFICDLELLASTNKGDFSIGDVGRINDMFKFPESFAKVRRFLATCKSASIGEPVSEQTLNMASDEETEKELMRLVGESNPLKGALVTLIMDSKKSKSGQEYSTWQAQLPTEEDLRNAGLI